MLRKERRFGKILHAVVQRLRESFNEGTAAGGTCLIEEDVVHCVVLDADALHVLSADVENTVHFRIEEGCRIVVRDGLNFALVQEESRFEQSFAVTGGAAAHNMGVLGQELLDLLDGADGSLDGASLVAAVEGVQKRAVLADQRELGGCGTCVYAQIAVAVIVGKVTPHHAGFAMAFCKGVVFFLRLEQRIHAADLKLHLDLAGELLLHLGEKMERASQESDVAADRLSAGKSADGLVDHCLEDRSRQVLFGGALVDQGLDVGLGKNAAAGGNCIKRSIILGVFVEAGGVCLQQGRHLIDERTRSAGTDAVHALLHISVLKVDDLGVFASQLDGYICLGRDLLEGSGDRHDLLHKRHAEVVGQGQTAGSGDDRMDRAVAELLCRFRKKVKQRSADIGVVTAVIRK